MARFHTERVLEELTTLHRRHIRLLFPGNRRTILSVLGVGPHWDREGNGGLKNWHKLAIFNLWISANTDKYIPLRPIRRCLDILTEDGMNINQQAYLFGVGLNTHLRLRDPTITPRSKPIQLGFSYAAELIHRIESDPESFSDVLSTFSRHLESAIRKSQSNQRSREIERFLREVASHAKSAPFDSRLELHGDSGTLSVLPAFDYRRQESSSRIRRVKSRG